MWINSIFFVLNKQSTLCILAIPLFTAAVLCDNFGCILLVHDFSGIIIRVCGITCASSILNILDLLTELKDLLGFKKCGVQV